MDPLALGIHREIKSKYPEILMAGLGRFLYGWTKRKWYLDLLESGAVRMHLDGSIQAELNERLNDEAGNGDTDRG